jgi:crossover junction endodeoxyribonuclease RuvC
MIILGIDPGTARTGYGVIRTVGKKTSFLDHGCVETPAENSYPARLLQTHTEISKLLKRYQPHYVAIERLFFFRNMKTVMTVSQSRGVVLLACESYKIPIFEYTPLEIKQTLSGYGRANKKQIQERVKNLLNLQEIPKPDDAADGLAAAICHHFKTKNLAPFDPIEIKKK